MRSCVKKANEIKEKEREKNSKKSSWAWWYTPIILAPGKQRQEDQKFKVILDYKAWA